MDSTKLLELLKKNVVVDYKGLTFGLIKEYGIDGMRKLAAKTPWLIDDNLVEKLAQTIAEHEAELQKADESAAQNAKPVSGTVVK